MDPHPNNPQIVCHNLMLFIILGNMSLSYGGNKILFRQIGKKKKKRSINQSTKMKIGGHSFSGKPTENVVSIMRVVVSWF